MNKQIAPIKIKTEGTVVQLPPGHPARLLELAIDKGADVNQLSKLMDLQERWEKKEAKKTFLKALAKFQNKVPELKKSKKINYTTQSGSDVSYSYTPLGEIQKQIKSALSRNGLSFRWTFKNLKDEISVTCIVSHEAGHSEETTMSASADTSGGKNSIQSRGSTLQYLRRYTLTGALGISSAEEDPDGQTPPPKKINIVDVNKKLATLKKRKEVTDYFFSLDAATQRLPAIKKAFKKRQDELPGQKKEEDV